MGTIDNSRPPLIALEHRDEEDRHIRVLEATRPSFVGRTLNALVGPFRLTDARLAW